MEWNTNFNYSDIGNGSVYINGNFGAWSEISSRYNFGDSKFFGSDSSQFLKAIFSEIFKSGIITIISLAGITRIKRNNLKNNVANLVEILAILVVALTFYSLLTIFLIPFAFYRLLVYTYFQWYRPTCVLMHGTDAFWCTDSQEAKSIINIMVLLKIKNKDENLLQSISKLMLKLCKDPVFGIKFTSYRKYSKSGYFYWEKGSLENIKDNMSYIENDINNENDLKLYLSDISNKTVEGFGWQILICKNDLDDNNLRPVVFRMHHSIGDGASILKALINTISDQSHSRFTLSQTFNISFQPHGTNFRFTVPQSEPFQVRKNKIINDLKFNLYKIPSFIKGPFNLISKLFIKDEISHFSTDKLEGKKIITWYSDQETLQNIKSIKRKFNSSFSEAAFALLSNSIEKYLEKRGGAPEHISVVVPIFGDMRTDLKISSQIVREGNNIKVSRLSEKQSGMTNGFWVAMLQLPIKQQQSQTFKSKISYVKQSTHLLRRSPDFIMYKFILSVILTLVPGKLVQPMFNVAKNHLVYSNLPGPENEIKIAGNPLKQMTFWLPNRGTTGLGFSLLSNNKRLSIGLIADTGVVSSHDDLNSILHDFVSSARKECC